MRIIAGEFRRRLLATPKDAEKTRPIPDRVKESLFSMLHGHCEGATVFDGFSGTGAIGLEAISRGASKCVLVERDREIAELLRQNIETLGVGDRCELIAGDALGPGALARCPRPVTLVFLDPPYPIMREPVGFRRVMGQFEKLVSFLTDDGFAVLRTPWPVRHFVSESGEPIVGGVEGAAAATPMPPVEVDARRRKKEKVSHKKKERRRSEWFDEAAPEDEDGVDAELSGLSQDDLAAVDAKPAGKWVEVSLAVPGATGPETHVYHNMAVHLYMRKK
jgi:16S rRNA (guanine(966)-N(2))-methyltransferase RsmD